MTDVGIDTGQAPATEPPAISQPSLTPSEAGRFMASLRRKAEQPAQPTEQRQEQAAPVQQESPAQAEDAAPPQEAPGETQEAEPESIPPIEPPRSWTKDAKERWQTLPRETQEYLAEREQERDREVRRSQNDTAEKLKGLTAKEQAVEQARQQYEAALPLLMQNLQSVMAGEFSDLKSMDDVQRMATEDWPRYIRWDAAQKRLAAVQQEMQVSQQRQQTETQQKFAEFSKEQDRLFVEKVPDMADEKKAAELQKAAIASLKSAGFAEDELAGAWQGAVNVPFRDHRVQLMIHKAALWDQAQAKAKTITTNAKPVPQVQRPGAKRVTGADNAAEVQRLEAQLDSGKLTVRQQLEVAAQLRSMKAPLMPRKAS